MPKIDIDYSNTIIYKIFCRDPLIKELYVGHTTNFVQRKYAHKQTCNNIKSPCYNLKLYKTIRSNGNWSNWDMVTVNFYNCKNQFEARQKEQEYFISLKATLNSVEPLPQKKNINMLPINTQPNLTIILPINPTIIQSIKPTSMLSIIPTEQPNPIKQFKLNKKTSNKYSCLKCDYNTLNLTDYKKHLLTVKHLGNVDCDLDNGTFFCKCGKIFKTNSGLWKHNKKCIDKPKNEILNDKIKEETELGKLTELFLDVVKQNQELQKTLLEMSSKMTVPINNTINNNTTNNFNLNVFLNETCKDALNLTDFVSSLQVKLKDLEETAKIGYTQGVSKIFINGLNELEVNMRPIHCSDAKRETLYIKNNDEWTKEDPDKSNITKAVKKVSNKNIQQVFEWQKKYPEYKDPESKQNDKYQEMLFTAMGGSTDDEQSNNLEKIIRNITKEVIIDKNL